MYYCKCPSTGSGEPHQPHTPTLLGESESESKIEQ